MVFFTIDDYRPVHESRGVAMNHFETSAMVYVDFPGYEPLPTD